MSAYRFCRSDDVPLLVAAHNACYATHVPGVPVLTVEGFKRLVRERELWTSSCMVAFSGDEPIGVLLAAKRERENLIHCVGIHPAHRRQGHGRHLLTSLGQKMAILGPPRLVAEVPADWSGARAFLWACGYRLEGEALDFVHPGAPGAVAPALVVPVTFADLHAAAVLDPVGPRPWSRSPAELARRAGTLSGLAVASEERVEAWLLYHDAAAAGGAREVVGFDCASRSRVEPLLGLLFRTCCASGGRPVRIDKVLASEIDPGLLEAWGFRRGAASALYARQAGAA